MEQELEMVFNAINRWGDQERLIFGIDGLSRSGKTTFANAMVEKADTLGMECRLFHIDDLIVERTRRYRTGFDEWQEHYELQWPVKKLEEVFFSKLKNAQQVELPCYDALEDACKVKTLILPKQAFIIVEGVFLQRTEWRPYFDKVIYLACPRTKRFLRETKAVQQNIEKMERRYWKAERHYETTVKPEQQADWVLHCTEKGAETR